MGYGQLIKKLRSITNKYFAGTLTLIIFFTIWQVLCMTKAVPPYMLPTPMKVARAFFTDIELLARHSVTTLSEAFLGLGASIILGLFFAVVMDNVKFVYKMLYPVMIVSQAIPVIAIAPLLVLWFGYGIFPKVLLIVLVCFFPIVVSLYDAFKNTDEDRVQLLVSMGANKWQQFRHIKLPSAMPGFFSALKISVTYSVVGAVISEWLGGEMGLGVYMQRVRKSFAFDKMFAVIFLIVFISIVLIGVVKMIESRVLKYRNIKK